MQAFKSNANYEHIYMKKKELPFMSPTDSQYGPVLMMRVLITRRLLKNGLDLLDSFLSHHVLQVWYRLSAHRRAIITVTIVKIILLLSEA